MNVCVVLFKKHVCHVHVRAPSSGLADSVAMFKSIFLRMYFGLTVALLVSVFVLYSYSATWSKSSDGSLVHVITNKSLIFDIGMNIGQDTIVYLGQGYTVVAVEA